MSAAFMLVPKATVHLDRYPVLRQHDVRRARKVAAVQAEAETHGVQEAAHAELGPSMRLADRAHDL